MQCREPIEEAPPVVIASLPTDKRGLIRHLETTNPEALALARDWDDIAKALVKTQEKVARYVLSASYHRLWSHGGRAEWSRLGYPLEV